MDGELMLGRTAIAMQFVLPYCGWRELLALEQVLKCYRKYELMPFCGSFVSNMISRVGRL